MTPVREVVDPAEEASSVRLAPARDGYVLSWASTAATGTRTRVALLDRNLEVAAGPASVPAELSQSVVRGSVVWLPAANRYLAAWFVKVSDGDDVWYQILDDGLAPITPAARLAQGGVKPQVGTDGEHFFVAWRSTSTDPDTLAAAVIDARGNVTPHEVTGAGGTPRGYSFVERNGQAVLVWSETGGDGPDLWLAPICP
jgi:hypothetical protein